ncbi:OLC1v1012130C1 [Oldenlandia corymbosa var. corymbosa]|uniref:MLO-like protein n=1 Tax=Oldenlandia corymbosa var. corymbosa TaxID=529605 RepID=A0AAV1DYF8_OLDCO|nr:OLC1v1012130C1 [Oldenlandia corymbosa var. corymbosa]
MAGGGGGGAAGESLTLEYTPTWVVAVVCTVIVAISLFVERLIHFAGKYFLKKGQNPLYQALLKIKEELMLLGFISLLLTVFQDKINKICIPKHLTDDWLPCKRKDTSTAAAAHFQTYFSSFFPGNHRRLLAEASASAGYCESKGKAPLLSLTALHHLHIFIFALAVSHVIFCALTILFASAKIRMWKSWEDSIRERESDPEEASKFKFVHGDDFIRGRFKDSAVLRWVLAFFKQFYRSVTKKDYETLRLGFIMTHFRGHTKFNFHKYMINVLEEDFKKVVGISWYLWIFVVLFLLLNVYGWHSYFWISFIPFALLLAVGTKLEHVIYQLAQEVAEKQSVVQGELVVRPSDDHFWFNRPKIVLMLIHVILFQNAFEMAVFFWTWAQYGFNSCIMGKMAYIIPRLVIGVFVQFICSFSTLPLYALVTQMGSSFKKAIFKEHIQVGLTGWAQKAKKKEGNRKGARSNNPSQVGPRESPSVEAEKVLLELEPVTKHENGRAHDEIQPET